MKFKFQCPYVKFEILLINKIMQFVYIEMGTTSSMLPPGLQIPEYLLYSPAEYFTAAVLPPDLLSLAYSLTSSAAR